MRRILLFSIVVAVGAPRDAAAQDVLVDVLHVTGQATALAGPNTRGFGIEWLHPFDDSAMVDLGVFSGSGGPAWWTYARVGAVSRHESVILSGLADIGGGRLDDAPYPYRRLQGTAVVPLAGRRIFAEGEVLHTRMASVSTHGFRAGAAVQWTARLSTRTNAHVLWTAGERSPAVSARVDYAKPRWALLAGGFVSRNPATMQVPIEGGSVLYASRGAFFGGQVRAGRQDVMATIDISKQPHGRATSLLLGVRIPIE
jgi:hypothetical protein